MSRGALALVVPLSLVALAPAAAHPDPTDDDVVELRRVDRAGAPTAAGLLVAGREEGTWATWHPSGYLFEVATLVDGREHGDATTYDDEGRLAVEGAWRHGRPHGLWRFFHEGGAVASEGAYVDGLRAGPWVERFADGTIFRVRTWIDGALPEGVEGEAELNCRDFGGAWRVDLAERTEGCVDDDGDRMGAWRGFHPNGRVAWERTYAAGLLDEQGFDYHPDGALLHEGAYRIGAPDGLHVWLAADGAVLLAFEYSQGTGPWRAYHPSGAVAEEGAWQGYRRDGRWRTWDERGRLSSDVVWRAGRPVYERARRGDLWVEGALSDAGREGEWSAWDDDGRVAWRGTYVGGEREGAWLVDGVELVFVGDLVMSSRRSWPSGAPREERTIASRTAIWPDGTLLYAPVMTEPDRSPPRDEDFMAPSRWTGRLADEATWQEALEVQAFLLADPRPTPARFASTLGRARALAGSPGGRVVEPEAPMLLPAEGGTNDAGEPHGTWTYFDEDGRKVEQGRFEGGARVGVWRGWDRDGRLAWEGAFISDRRDGPWRSFRREAAPRLEPLVEGRYAADARTGAWTWYHPGGRPRVVGGYDHDLAAGPWRGLALDGTVVWEGSYRRGERVGRWRFVSPDGRERTRDYGPRER